MPGHDYVKSGRLAVTDKTKPIYIYIYIYITAHIYNYIYIYKYIYIYIYMCKTIYLIRLCSLKIKREKKLCEIDRVLKNKNKIITKKLKYLSN